MSELGNKIRQKLPKILLNLAVLFSVWFIATLISPAVQSLGSVIPGAQISTGFLIIASLIVVMMFFAIAVIQDTLAVADALAETLVHLAPLMKKEEASDIKKAIKEIVLALVLILLTPFLPGMLALIPVIGQMLATIAIWFIVIVSLALFWAAGKILYKELSKYTTHIAEVVAGEEEKLESKKAPARKAPARRKRR
jgi:hypothetical protein